MTTQTTITLLSIFLPLIGATVGYFIKYYIDEKRELTSEIAKERREIYQKYVNLMIGVFADAKSKKEVTMTNWLRSYMNFIKNMCYMLRLELLRHSQIISS